MKFSINKSIEILERTPDTLICWTESISKDWTINNEGGETWSVYDVIGHLIHGEKVDWMIRAELILSKNSKKTFEPFDRYAQFENSKGKSLTELLTEFKEIRVENMAQLRKLNINGDELKKTGIHPALGEVTLEQLLATWVVHDLDHIAQIARVMAEHYKDEVGPWL